MQEIELTRGRIALVDDEDYEELSKHLWYATSGGYAYRGVRDLTKKKKQAHLSMHRHILGLDSNDPRVVDHIDNNPLNNCRSNLRICNIGDNAKNRRARPENASGFRGVYTYPQDRTRWRAMIGHNGKSIHLGLFSTPEAAHNAYCEAAKTLFGEFVNFKKMA
jgi:hypothetical protein